MTTHINKTPLIGETEHAIRSNIKNLLVITAVLGVLSVIVGLIIIFNPKFSIETISFLFGAGLVFSGLWQLIFAFTNGLSISWRVLYLISGAVTLIGGIIALGSFPVSIILLLTVLGFAWIFRGVTAITASFFASRFDAAHFILGLLAVIAGIAVLLSPAFATVTLTFLLYFGGFSFLVLGVFELLAAIRFHSIIKHHTIATHVA